MQILPNHYQSAIQSLSKYNQLNPTKLPQFLQSVQMSYANETIVQEKSDNLFKTVVEYLKAIPQGNKLFFKENDIVYIPDLHGDFVHLITTLHRHNLLDTDLKLKNGFKYILLGDIYNRGKDSNVIDCWLNKQIERGIESYRLIGNHELFFVTRKEDGQLLTVNARNHNPLFIPSNDIQADILNGYKVTEELLKNMKDGKLLAAYAALNTEINVPMLYTHSFVINEDLNKLLSDGSKDIFNFVEVLNNRLQKVGKVSYECFVDCKTKDKYDWKEINAPFASDPFFNIRGRDVNGRHTSYLMRVTGLAERPGVLSTNISDELPSGVYQTVGHTMVFHFDLPKGFPDNGPIIMSNKSKNAFVQFSDVGVGSSYKDDSFERPDVTFNKELSEEL